MLLLFNFWQTFDIYFNILERTLSLLVVWSLVSYLACLQPSDEDDERQWFWIFVSLLSRVMSGWIFPPRFFSTFPRAVSCFVSPVAQRLPGRDRLWLLLLLTCWPCVCLSRAISAALVSTGSESGDPVDRFSVLCILALQLFILCFVSWSCFFVSTMSGSWTTLIIPPPYYQLSTK